MAGGARRSAKKKHKLSLLDLPPAVLQQIFTMELGVVHLSTLLVCRTLLPHALRGLYRWVVLPREVSIQRFAQTISRRPQRAKDVWSLQMTVEARRTTSARLGSILKAEMGGKRGEWRNVEPADWRLGVGRQSLVTSTRSMLKQLSSLIALHLTGEWLILGIFDEAFLQEDVFEVLRILKLELHDGEDYDNPAAATLSRNLAKHLSLYRLSFTGNCVELPLDLLNLSPSVALPPRSWSLEDFSLNLLVLIGPESRNLFSAFKGLSSLHVTTLMVHDDFMRDLALLPPTLVSLTLVFGVTCPGDPDLVVPHPAFGEYGDLPPHFPNLIDLTLGGDIVTLATFNFIRTSLPSLLLRTSFSWRSTSALVSRASLSPVEHDASPSGRRNLASKRRRSLSNMRTKKA